MAWDWAVGGVTEEVPRTMGTECENYLTNRRRWIEAVLFCIVFIFVIRWAIKRLEPIQLPDAKELEKPHSGTRIALLLIMTLIFGIEMGFKLANRSVIFVLNPCHIQTLVQIYILAAKPSRTTTTMFRIQMNNLNGPVLAFLFPEVECRTLPFEQATYWIQHAMLYIIPVYILRTGAYQAEDIRDFNWCIIGVELQLLYHFSVLNYFSILTGINLNHMLCAAESDPFQGQQYRIAAVIHESILCPILNKLTVYMFSTPQSIQLSTKLKGKQKPTTAATNRPQLTQYEKLTTQSALETTSLSAPLSSSSSKPLGTSKALSPSSVSTLKMSPEQQLQQHKPPSTACSKLYIHEDALTSPQLIHRRNIPPSSSTLISDYNINTTSQQHPPPPRHHRLPDEDKAVFELESDEQDDMEVVEPTKLPPPESITARYRMPTTKID